MNDDPNTTIRITLAAIALGLALAFAGALVSVAGDYYRLDVPVLLAGVLPYAVLGMLAGLMAGRALGAVAAGVFFIHLAAVLMTDPGTGARAAVPLLLVLVPLVLLPGVIQSIRAGASPSAGGES
ncbi:hypothetical protein [Thioalbus denitrificans]|uniref:Uncharacterized protein n=1 Tax=Thioalbus denitrificans TaxID=547122 RepID=A0A369CBB4_9GAMM|nr:hypothetical protein [Thioalbus denitrificans]RCX31179.1 hypothetical protein DFQ59_103143 [Thioalbus denitrificans]